MKVRFWGTRGSIASPGKDTVVFGGNTCCLEITAASGRTIIIDAGTGIRPLGEDLLKRQGAPEVLLLMTHNHWDHVQGFPFFGPAYERDWVIQVDGFPGCMKGLSAIFDNRLGDGFFPIAFKELKADIRHIGRLAGMPVQVDGLSIEAMAVQHPQGGLGFRFTEEGKRLVFLTDNELSVDAWTRHKPADYARFCQGADVLIHDAQYTPAERAGRIGWGHSDFVSVLNLAMEAGVERLLLFHHDPARLDQTLFAILDDCHHLAHDLNASLEIDAAREGTEITV